MGRIFDADFFSKMNTLKLKTSLVLSAGMGGPRKSSAKGSSVEFSDFREYMLGDDIRRIDWNAYGRMDRLFIKQFMEEKEGIFRIFVDCSESMAYGEKKKSEHALKIAGAISYLALNNLDRVYVTTVNGEQTKVSKGMVGRQAFMKLAMELENTIVNGGTDLGKTILSTPFSQKGTVILISDFFDQKELEQALRYLAYSKQEIIVIQILAREELNPQLDGTLSLIDMESKGEMKITMTGKVMKTYEETLTSFITEIMERTKHYQGTYLLSPSDQSLDAFLYECMKHGKVV